jgi:hypothetical protein
MNRRPPIALLALAVAAPLFAGFSAVAAPDLPECAPGLQAQYVDGAWLCTHDDEPPPGVDTTEMPSTEQLYADRYGVEEPVVVASDALVAAADAPVATVAATTSVACIDDGTSGPRVELVYARAADVPNRYSAVLPLIRQYAKDADDIINTSAGRVGDGRRVRYVTNSACEPKVANITLTKEGDDSFAKTVTEVRNQGYSSSDRKYLIFVDAAVGICGLGEVYIDDRPGQENPNNSGRPMYARVDTACWQHAAAHELVHTLGAVQNSAPNSSGAGHCTDEVDLMCYRDTPTTVTKQVCTRAGQVDCNNDDYFHPNPKAGSYLAAKWNVADSRFLSSGAAPPPPAQTSVRVPSSGLAGVPWTVRADVATTGAGIAWSSTLSQCRFADPNAAVTTCACPGTMEGTDGQVTVHVTENGLTTPYAYPVSFVVPSPPRAAGLSLTASAAKIKSGQRVTLTGTMTESSSGQPVYGMPVELRARQARSSTWTTVATMTTGLAGKVSRTFRPRKNTVYVMMSGGSQTWSSASSPQATVEVATKVKARLSKSKVKRNRTTRVAGAVSPDKAGKVIRLKRYKSGRWVTVEKKRISEDSRYVFRYTPRDTGKHRLRVVKPADRKNVRGRTAVVLRVAR